MSTEVEGVDDFAKELDRMLKTEYSPVQVHVGYTQSYAMPVHENLTAHHPVGQAKYLEEPFRDMAPELLNIIEQNTKKGLSFRQAMVVAGLKLQRTSQKLVPVDTGALKASAYTRVEEES